jgi:hypothetical protein
MSRWESPSRAARCTPPDDALGTALYLAGRGLWVVSGIRGCPDRS